MKQLDDCRILLIEDEPLLAMDIELILSNAGCRVIGPATNVRAALAEIERHEIDGALLDLNLGGEMVFPVLDQLRSRCIPFAVVSGHSPSMLPERHSGSPFLPKPYSAAEVIGLVRGLLRDENCRAAFRSA